MVKKILTYGIGGSHFQEIALRNPGILLKADEADLDRTVGSLFDTENTEEKIPAQREEEYLIFRGFENEEISSFVSSLRKEGYPFDGILVCETETNREWTLRQLLEGTLQEHRYFQERRRLTAILRYCEKLEPETVSKQTAGNIMAAFAALQNPEADEKELRTRGILLSESLAKDGLI